MPEPEALSVAKQIAEALEAAHAKGILHRDLKSGNILIAANGAKLLDFGLAKLMADAEATQTIGVSGTPLYMSPEQAEGKALDARSDVFSLGAVLYEVLSGHRAFDSLAAVLRDEPKPLTSPLADIVRRCLAKQPADRFQTIVDLKAALERCGLKPALRAAACIISVKSVSRSGGIGYSRRRGPSKTLPLGSIEPLRLPALPETPISYSMVS